MAKVSSTVLSSTLSSADSTCPRYLLKIAFAADSTPVVASKSASTAALVASVGLFRLATSSGRSVLHLCGKSCLLMMASASEICA